MFDTPCERLRQPLRRLRIRSTERTRNGLPQLESDQRLSLAHGCGDLIHHRHRNAILNLTREASEWRLPRSQHLPRPRGSRVRELNKKLFLLLLHMRDLAKCLAEHVNAGAALNKSMHLDAFPVPWAECPREGNDRETTPRHTGGQHCGLSHADDGDVEELPSAEQPGIPEGRDNRRINLVMGLGKRLEGHSPPICASARVAM